MDLGYHSISLHELSYIMHRKPKQARTITVREAARIQSFPDDYEFIGSMTDQFRMIGNAVPPEFARRLAMAVNELLFENE